MARIVISSWGSYGDVNPYLGLALALRARGHMPVLAIPSYYRAVVEHEGLQHATVGPEVEPGDTDLVQRIMHARTGTEFLLRELLAPARAPHDATLDGARGGIAGAARLTAGEAPGVRGTALADARARALLPCARRAAGGLAA